MKKEKLIFKYRATDKNGLTFEFTHKPTPNDKSNSWRVQEKTGVRFYSNNPPTEDWKQTLVEI